MNNPLNEIFPKKFPQKSQAYKSNRGIHNAAPLTAEYAKYAESKLQIGGTREPFGGNDRLAETLFCFPCISRIQRLINLRLAWRKSTPILNSSYRSRNPQRISGPFVSGVQHMFPNHRS